MVLNWCSILMTVYMRPRCSPVGVGPSLEAVSTVNVLTWQWSHVREGRGLWPVSHTLGFEQAALQRGGFFKPTGRSMLAGPHFGKRASMINFTFNGVTYAFNRNRRGRLLCVRRA